MKNKTVEKFVEDKRGLTHGEFLLLVGIITLGIMPALLVLIRAVLEHVPPGYIAIGLGGGAVLFLLLRATVNRAREERW